MKLLARITRPKRQNLDVIEEKNSSITESTLNIRYLKDAVDDYENDTLSTTNDSISSQDQTFNGFTFLDKTKIEEKVIKVVNGLSNDEKENIAEHLRDIIRQIINEEYNLVLRETSAADIITYINTSQSNESLITQSTVPVDGIYALNILDSEDSLISSLSKYDKNQISLAYIYAANKERVERKLGVQAAHNLDKTIISKLETAFKTNTIYAYNGNYAVFDASGNYEAFIKNLNTFRKAIFSVNTSNQFKFTIELNISDVKGFEYSTLEDCLYSAKRICFDEDEDISCIDETEAPEINDLVTEAPRKDSINPEPPAYRVEFIDGDDDFDAPTDISNNNPNLPGLDHIVETKDLNDFPKVIINACITDKQNSSKVKIKLVINLIEQSNTKQEIMVSGHIGEKKILLVSDYANDKTTIQLDEEYGFILRFGSSIKTFILKEKKDRYELWQEITKNVFEKQPLTVAGMYVCPISQKDNTAAFIYTKDNEHQLIKTDDNGYLTLNGHSYQCFNDGKKFMLGLN